MIKEEYSPYKIIHHYDKLEAIKHSEQPDPIQVHLIPTNKCNQSCTFCAYRMPDYSSGEEFNENDVMPHEKLIETIYACNRLGVKAIQFTGGGEPLIHPSIKEALNLTKKLGMEIALVTNGMALDDELIDILSNVSWVRISIDAFTRETYSLIRRVKKTVYDKVIANIEKLAANKQSTTLGIGFVVNAENYKEIFNCGQLAKEIGADNYRISAAFTPSGLSYFDSFHDIAYTLSEKTKRELESSNFTVFNLFTDRIKDMFIGIQDYSFCPIKELVPYIAADQNIYTCCVLAYNKNGYIGNIKKQDFYKLWRSKEKQDFYKNHSPLNLCKIPCMFKNKNDFINYCIKKNVKHTNFI